MKLGYGSVIARHAMGEKSCLPGDGCKVEEPVKDLRATAADAQVDETA